MCGIAALFGKNLSEAIFSMGTLIRHRGPDDEGYAFFSKDGNHFLQGGPDTPEAIYKSAWLWTPHPKQHVDREIVAALGHRRLSIIDLSSAGHQPMCTQDGRYWISYNGEIYNYLELKKELQNLGHHFQTQTDTEVILKAFQEWDKDCFNFFNGMFAFVIYDKLKRKVTCARDRFGVKPLYYWVSPLGFLAIASEIKQFTVLPGWKAKMRGQRVYDFLNWGALDHTHETLFADVFQLRGGEFLNFSLDEGFDVQPKRWYHLKITPFQGSFSQASQHYLDLLKDAIHLRLRADVPVGSCLSGGLDSSTIVCLMSEILGEQNGKQLTFSACSENKKLDEKCFMDLVVEKTKVQAHYIYPTLEELFETNRDIIWHQDEPVGSTSIFAQWLVFKLAKEQKVKVILDGQGADELLAGYLGFFGNSFYDHFAKLRWLTLFDEMNLAKNHHPEVNPWTLLANKLVPDFVRQPIRKALGKSAKNPDWLNCEKLGAFCRDPFSHEKHKSLKDQSLQQLMRSSVPRLLHYEDRDSMAHSIESRVPFLDYRLVEFTLSLPVEYKIGKGWTKRVLREGMKGILPEEIRLRIDKKAFNTAEEDWMKQEPFKSMLQQALEISSEILHPSARDLTHSIVSGKKPFSHILWRMISFGQWMQCFKVSF